MEAILLCGGLGTRLRSVVSDRPKPMADIAGKPFLHYFVRMLSEKGVERFVFALGYMGEQIEAYFQDGREYGISIVYSYEESPLGTGGAIRNALSKMQEEDVLILNADTYFDTDYRSLFQEQSGKCADMTVASREIEDISRYGAIVKDTDGRILRWNEKKSGSGETTPNSVETLARSGETAPKSGEINGGIYVMKKSLIEKIPAGKQSLENDCIPVWLSHSVKIHALPSDGYFMDIGVPADYRRFQEDVQSGKIV